MGTALTIKYKQPDREEKYLPFCGYQSMTEHWLPLAEKHNLECLKYLEKLWIEDRERAEQLVQEIRFVEALLRQPDHGGIPQE